MVTDTWNDKHTGDKRTRQTVLVDAIGPSLRWATATITRAQRGTEPDPT
jgi:single-strand DNA-binding protein